MTATTLPAPATGYCAQCKRSVRVSEPYAFRGADRLRTTLACGHVVLRDKAFASAHVTSVARTGSHGYPWRGHCDCGWQSISYAAAHAAQSMADDHAATAGV